MDVIIQLNNQSAGRDKIASTIQYASKFLWYELQQMKSNVYLIEKLQYLESTLASFRKLLRFGRFSDSMYSALSSIKNPDYVLRLTLTLGKIANSLFLFADHIVWLSRAGFLKNVDANKWNLISNKYWLLNVIMNIIRDIYEIHKIIHYENIFKLKKEISSKPFNFHAYMCFLQNIITAIKSRQDVLIDTLKNCCDIWIPLAALQRVNLKPSTVGLLGTISSLVALFTMVQPLAKLVPA